MIRAGKLWSHQQRQMPLPLLGIDKATQEAAARWMRVRWKDVASDAIHRPVGGRQAAEQEREQHLPVEHEQWRTLGHQEAAMFQPSEHCQVVQRAALWFKNRYTHSWVRRSHNGGRTSRAESGRTNERVRTQHDPSRSGCRVRCVLVRVRLHDWQVNKKLLVWRQFESVSE